MLSSVFKVMVGPLKRRVHQQGSRVSRLQSRTGENENSYQLAACLSLLDIVSPGAAALALSISSSGLLGTDTCLNSALVTVSPPAECDSQLGCDDQHVRLNTK